MQPRQVSPGVQVDLRDGRVAAPQAPVKRVRGPNLASFITSANGVPMEEALQKADAAGCVIASNKRMSDALARIGWMRITGVFPCWTGTMVAYDEPSKRLERTIEYLDSKTGIRYIFPVPEEHMGKMNIALVAEHPDFTLVTDGQTRTVQAKKVGIVPEFPVATRNWHRADAEYDIPTGSIVDAKYDFARAARYIWRKDKMVGLVARVCGDLWNGLDKPSVVLNYAPSDAFGVAVEAP